MALSVKQKRDMRNVAVSIGATLLLLGGFFVFALNTQPKDENTVTPFNTEGEAVVATTSNQGPINGESQKRSMDTDGVKTARVVTNMGEFTIELYTDKMPITTDNFIKLAESGFYNQTKFHRVIAGFMIQGGDPNSKGDNVDTYGMGGPGYVIRDEFAEGLSNARGTISMANAGPNTGGSQFFINTVDNTYLDGKHPVFGKVKTGMDIVDTIGRVRTGTNDRPASPVIVQSVTIE